MSEIFALHTGWIVFGVICAFVLGWFVRSAFAELEARTIAAKDGDSDPTNDEYFERKPINSKGIALSPPVWIDKESDDKTIREWIEKSYGGTD